MLIMTSVFAISVYYIEQHSIVCLGRAEECILVASLQYWTCSRLQSTCYATLHSRAASHRKAASEVVVADCDCRFNDVLA